MRQVHCHTNLDLSSEEWPTELPTVPRLGDQIDSMTIHGDFRLSLMVVGIHWKYDGKYYPSIELHDHKQRSVREFYEWYAPLVSRSVSSFI